MSESFREKLDRELPEEASPEESLRQKVKSALEILRNLLEDGLGLHEISSPPSDATPDVVTEAPPGESAYTHSVNGQLIKLTPFWCFVPNTQKEVDRLERALEHAENWLLNNTAKCEKCERRVPLDAKNCPDHEPTAKNRA